jgi:hypothetical protein
MTATDESPEIISWIDFLESEDGSLAMVIRRAKKINDDWIFFEKNQMGKWVEFESGQNLIESVESARWP